MQMLIWNPKHSESAKDKDLRNTETAPKCRGICHYDESDAKKASDDYDDDDGDILLEQAGALCRQDDLFVQTLRVLENVEPLRLF